MKKSQQTQEIQLDETVKQLIETSDRNHAGYLDHVRKIAYTLAQARLPKPKDKLSPYVEEIIGHYQTERTNVILKLASSIQNMRTKVNISEPMKLIDEKRCQLDNHTRVLNNKLHDKNSIKINRDVFHHKLYNAVLWGITILECFWLALVFSGAFNDSNLLVVLGAFVISFGIIQGVKIATLKIRDAKVKIPFWVKLFTASIFFAVVVSLGLVRFSSVIVTSNETITGYQYLNNPIIFIVLTMIPLITTSLIVAKYFLSDEEVKLLREQEKLEEECKKQKEVITLCKQEIQDLTNTRNDIVNTGVKAEHAEKVLIERFDAYLLSAIGIFKLENLKHRDDGVHPNCFNEPSPILTPTSSHLYNNSTNQLP